MSSILDALEKLEGERGEPRTRPLRVVDLPDPPSIPWAGLLLGAASIVAVLAVGRAYLGSADVSIPSGETSHPRVAPAAEAAAPAVAATPTAPAGSSTRTAAPVPAPPDGTAPLVRSTRPPPLAIAPSSPPPPAVDEAPSAPVDDIAPVPITGGPIRVSFLLHSPTPARRRVALAIEGQSLVTLGEGESHGDLEVVRIHPDRVEVRYQGTLLTIPARG